MFADFGVAEGNKGIAQLERERLVDQRFWSSRAFEVLRV